MVDDRYQRLTFTFMELISEALLLLLPFLNLLVMSGVKWAYASGLKDRVTRNAKLRFILLLISFVGVFANSFLNGPVVDASVVGELLVNIVAALSVATVSHITYKVVKSA